MIGINNHNLKKKLKQHYYIFNYTIYYCIKEYELNFEISKPYTEYSLKNMNKYSS